MDTFPVFLFKDSYEPFTTLLAEHDIPFSQREYPYGTVRASGEVIEIITSTAIWAALASVIATYIKSRRSRKVIITMDNNTVVHAEGYSVKELELLLKKAKNLSAISPGEAKEEKAQLK